MPRNQALMFATLPPLAREICIRDPLLIWGMLLGDLGIVVAYIILPVCLWRLYARAPLARALPLLIGFGSFILLCGMTHLVGAVNVFRPYYGAEVSIKLATAVVSLGVAVATIRLLPALIQSGRDLEELRRFVGRAKLERGADVGDAGS